MKLCADCRDKPALPYRTLCNRCRHRRRYAAAKYNLCSCGCDTTTAYRFAPGHHTRLFSSAEQSRRGRMNDGSALRDTGSGRAYRKLRQVHEHRRVMEAKLGRPLLRSEIVHHEDENKRNNRLSNLKLMTQAEHARIHMLERWRAAKK